MISKKSVLTIKGIAISMIVLSHLMYITSIPSKVETILHPFGYLGVALFLFVSGYGCRISLENGSYRKKVFFKKRFVTVVPELAIVTVLFASIAFIYGIRTPIFKVVCNSIGLSSSMAKITWYILYQYFWYVVISFSSENRKRSLIILWLASIVAYVVSIGFEDSVLSNFKMWGLNCFSFPLGSTAALYRDRIEKCILSSSKKENLGSISLLFTAFCWSFFVCYVLLHNPSSLSLQNILKSVIAMLFAALVSFMFSVTEIKSIRKQSVTAKICGGG